MEQIQILGLRTFSDPNKVAEAFFEKKWRAPSVAHLFENIEAYLKKIPESEHWNLYYTCANCTETGGRHLVSQAVIPFDIDGIDVKKRLEYVPIVLKVLGLEQSQTGVIFSGNGLQFIVGLTVPITSDEYFNTHRLHYKAVTKKIDAALRGSGLSGHADAKVFTAARIMRMPLTWNKKKDKPTRLGELINRHIVPIDFDLVAVSGLPQVEAADQIHPSTLRTFGPADTSGVLNGCDFLKHCRDNPAQIDETEWYAMLSITGRLEGGFEISQTLSQGHPKYSREETTDKIEQALAASGPRRCKNINTLWGKCAVCPNFGKVESPISIKSAEFIPTQSTGFHSQRINEKGMVIKKPEHDDLIKDFYQTHAYFVVEGGNPCYIWTGTHWKTYSSGALEAYAQNKFKPSADTKMTTEFKNRVCRTRHKPIDWLADSTYRKINFKNGILDLETMELVPHSQDCAFRYVLDYEYDPTAKAPRFEQFLLEIMGGDQGMANILMEYAGYAFSGDDCWAHKVLILTGDGSNGKSTFARVLKSLAGKANFTAVPIAKLREDTSLVNLDGKLFNLAEETPGSALLDSSSFKSIIDGGEMMVRTLYKQGYMTKNKTKLIFACNELPQTPDASKGYFRRLLIVPFRKEFEGASKDPFIDKKLADELPGVFNLLIEGYHRLRRQECFTHSEVISEVIDAYRSEIDSVKAWVEDCCEFQPPNDCTMKPLLSEMYDNYKFFTDKNGDKKVSKSVFAKRICKLIPDYLSRYSRPRIKGKKEIILAGVKFAEMREH